MFGADSSSIPQHQSTPTLSAALSQHPQHLAPLAALLNPHNVSRSPPSNPHIVRDIAILSQCFGSSFKTKGAPIMIFIHLKPI